MFLSEITNEVFCNSAIVISVTFALVVLLYFLYKYVYSPHQYLKRIGIPGPSPLPFIGNLHQSKHLLVNLNSQLCAQYGGTCGFYGGTTPYIVTTDPEMVRQFAIKKFDCFENRAVGGRLVFDVDGKKVPVLATMQGGEWRTVRFAVTPAFSGHKMKMVEPMVRDSAKLLLEKFGEVAGTGKSLNMTELYKKMSLEIILAVAFGREIRVQKGDGDQLFQEAKKLMEILTRTPGGHVTALLSIGAMLPWLGALRPLIEPFTQFGKSKDYLIAVAQKLRDARRKENGSTNKMDLLQVMLDAVKANKIEDAHSVVMSIVALIGGHEPITNSIIFTSHLLATNSDIQQKLISEIAEYFSDNPDKSYYEAAQEMEYLDMVFQETMRMYAPASLVVRRCNKSCEVGGYSIKEGTYMVTPIYGVHYNKEYWPEPEKFDPERFNKENKAKQHPCAYIPFGAGPRQCIGMRLAILQAKMVLIEILRKYKFADTKVPLEVNFSVTSSPKDDVYLCVESLTPNLPDL